MEKLFEYASEYAKGYADVGYDDDQIASVRDAFIDGAKWQKNHVWHDKKEPLPIGEIAIIRYNSIVIGWANDTHDGIEDEHGRLITKDFTKWALVKDLI